MFSHVIEGRPERQLPLSRADKLRMTIENWKRLAVEADRLMRLLERLRELAVRRVVQLEQAN